MPQVGEPISGTPDTGAVVSPAAPVPGEKPLNSDPLAGLKDVVNAAREAAQTPKAQFGKQFGEIASPVEATSVTPPASESNSPVVASDVATGPAPDLDTTLAGLTTVSSDVVQPPAPAKDLASVVPADDQAPAETPTPEVPAVAQPEQTSDPREEAVVKAVKTAFEKLRREEEMEITPKS